MSSVKKPENIYELKQVLKPELYEGLSRIHNKDDPTIDEYLKKFIQFFKSGYTQSMKEGLITDIERQIDTVKQYDESRNKIKNEYIEACGEYVEQSKQLFDKLNNLYEADKKVNDSVYENIKTQIQGQIKLIKQEIRKLKIPEPVASSGAPALSDDDTNLNKLLDDLLQLLDGMVQKITDSIKQAMNDTFNIKFYKSVLESKPSVDPGIIKSLTKGLASMISGGGINSQVGSFMALLNKQKSDGDPIIANPGTISSSFNTLAEALKQTLTENGDIFKELVNIIQDKITMISKQIEPEITALKPVPEMAQDASVSGTVVGGGGGNGDGSTFAAYPVSNKSKKNRNNGNGNSRGKGKGKGKGRKPNATKKNNRR